MQRQAIRQSNLICIHATPPLISHQLALLPRYSSFFPHSSISIRVKYSLDTSTTLVEQPPDEVAEPGADQTSDERADAGDHRAEKQRLAFARILLHRPDIIVLDEATSALDPASQDKLMGLLTEKLDSTTIISVGHRPELEAFHSRDRLGATARRSAFRHRHQPDPTASP
jgi:ABC-type phosphate transport system ATPase subunit